MKRKVQIGGVAALAVLFLLLSFYFIHAGSTLKQVVVNEPANETMFGQPIPPTMFQAPRIDAVPTPPVKTIAAPASSRRSLCRKRHKKREA